MSVQSQTISSQTIASDFEIMMVDYRPMRRGAAILGNVSDFMSGADTNCPEISSGDTAWMMTATAFVLFMTVRKFSSSEMFYAQCVLGGKYVF